MSDLSDLAFDLTSDLPANVRKVIDTAVANGWELNAPGMTVALRLNHPTDDLAQPVYVVWAVGRTPKGAMSFRFSSCGTQGMVQLKGPDLLEYLQDPTVIYETDEEIKAKEAAYDAKDAAKMDALKWDKYEKDPVVNTAHMLGAVAIEVTNTTAQDLMSDQKSRIMASFKEETSGNQSSAATPLRVNL